MGSHLTKEQSGFKPGLRFISVFWKDNGHNTAIATIIFEEPDGYHTARSALCTISVPSFLHFTGLELSLDFVLGISGWDVSQGPKIEDCWHLVGSCPWPFADADPSPAMLAGTQSLFPAPSLYSDVGVISY